jgi:hypothetical protein
MKLEIITANAEDLESLTLRDLVALRPPHTLLAANIVVEGPSPDEESSGVYNESLMERQEFAFWFTPTADGAGETETVVVRLQHATEPDDQPDEWVESRFDFPDNMPLDEAVIAWIGSLSVPFVVELGFLFSWPGHQEI